MIITYKYEHFVQFTVDMLDNFLRKGINIAFQVLGRSASFCNPGLVCVLKISDYICTDHEGKRKMDF